jgi:CheY-like chemotaxis protein
MVSRILLADSPAADFSLLQQRLTAAGFVVVYVQPPLDPFGAFVATPCDAVVLHLDYPHAQQICQALRQSANGATTPVVFVGHGTGGIDSPASALAAGADAFWRLPVDLAAAYRRLVIWVGRPLQASGDTPQTRLEPPPRAGWAKGDQAPRRFLRAPVAAAQNSQRQAALPVHRAPPPAAHGIGPRGLQVGSAAIDQAPRCTPWVDPEQAAREEIRAACANMQVVDYFTLLGLPADAPALLIDTALRQMQARYHASVYSWSLQHEARRELALIAQMLAEARWVLEDPHRRQAYRAHMQPSSQAARRRRSSNDWGRANR